MTPSERWNTDDDDELRSPLSKRKKIAADRSGSSKLKEMLIAETDGDEEDESQTRDSQPGTPRRNSVEDDGEGYDMAGRSRGDVAERRMEQALRQREEEERNRFNERCRAMRPETRRYFRRAEADAGPSRRSGSSGESSN